MFSRALILVAGMLAMAAAVSAAPAPLKRQDTTVYNGQASYTEFNGGYGNCGSQVQNSEAAVGIDRNVYGNGDHCFQFIEITARGKTVRAQVVDSTDGDGALNLSTSLFEQFAPLDAGVFDASWQFVQSDN
ncbi:RlpA-like double-psi beta-barrel domain [Ceraceosorus bombacis]|uniref:RlpA-like double-psi beta-barrel domain n=1 Tax=Ceraceosorus bombacis TaxID=401625 RepID=A0A0N7L9T7_9BASI|nr:RlpA-like double-psi beta-barrel domain [Ceraceosorus bombacis]